MPPSTAQPVPADSPPHVCLGCGCTCDDIDWHAATLAQSRACPIGIEWFEQSCSGGPVAQIEGREASLEEAMARAEEILDAAKLPLVTGLQTTTSEAQRLACGLADYWGAVCDSTMSPLDADSTIALQTTGAVTATLGEVAQRADVVVLWGCDLVAELPRHFERYSLVPTSPWLPEGARQRTLIVIDDRPNSSAGPASWELRIAEGQHYEALSLLRMILRDQDKGAYSPAQSTGVEISQWHKLAAQMRGAKFGAVIYGKRLATGFGEAVGALTHCMTELTRSTRWVALPAGSPGNPAGAIAVSTWQTGFPLGVDFSHRYPRYGTEWLTERVLANREVDAVLIAGDSLWGRLSPAAEESLSRLPTIEFDWRTTSGTTPATVRFRIARPAIEAGGSVYRVDGVALPVRSPRATTYPTTESVLKELVRRRLVALSET